MKKCLIAYSCTISFLFSKSGNLFNSEKIKCAISFHIAHNTRICSQILQAVGIKTYVVVAFSQITIVLINTYGTQNMCIKYALLIVVLATNLN